MNFLSLLILDKMIFVGNLSEPSLDYLIDEDVGIDLNSTLKYWINAFNFEKTHYRLNIFLNIIVQYIDKERNITLNTIEDSFNNKHFNYVFLIIIYIIFFLIMFFFYWIPMVRSLDMEIYKTKKMLSIIPLQILTSHQNIREPLNISKKTE